MDSSIEIISPPDDLIEIYETIFSEDLKEFVVKICRQFDSKIDRIFVERLKRRILLEEREFNEVVESLESLAGFVAKKFTGLDFGVTHGGDPHQRHQMTHGERGVCLK